MFGCFQSSNLTPRKVLRFLCNATILIICSINIFLLFSDLSNSNQQLFFASILPFEAMIVLNTVVVPGIFCDLEGLLFVWIVIYATLLLVGAILIACNQQIPTLIPIVSTTATNFTCYIFNLTDLNDMQMEKIGYVITLGLYLMVFVADVILAGIKQEPPALPYYVPASSTVPPTDPISSRPQRSTSIQSLPTYSEAEMLPSYEEAVIKQEVQQK